MSRSSFAWHSAGAAVLLMVSLGAPACGGNDDTGAQPGADAAAGSSSSGHTSNAHCLPTEYPDAESFAGNAATELSLRDQIEVFDAALAVAEGSEASDESTAALLASFEGGEPSLASAVGDAHAELVRQALQRFALGRGRDWQAGVAQPGLYPAGEGHVVDAQGVVLREWIRYVLYTGMFARQRPLWSDLKAAQPAFVDRIVAAFGGSPSFAAPGTEGGVVQAAQLAYERDPRVVDRAGLFSKFASVSAMAKLSSAQLPSCDYELARTLPSLGELWEETLAATAVYSLNQAKLGFAASSDEAGRAAALSELSRAAGALQGLGAVPAGSRVLTDEDLQTALQALRLGPSPADETDGPHRFVSGEADPAEAADTAIAAIKLAYDFMSYEIEDFEGKYTGP